MDYQHANKGWWRAKVVDYDPLTNLHALDSTGVDLSADNWFFVPDISLNSLLLNGELKLVPLNRELPLPALDVILNDQTPLNENLIGHTLSLQGLRGSRWCSCEVLEFNKETLLHTVVNRGVTWSVDLNLALRDNHLRYPDAPHLFQHIGSGLRRVANDKQSRQP